MNVLFIGDYHLNEKAIDKEVCDRLDYVKSTYSLNRLITWDCAGTCEIAKTWAFDNKIDCSVYEASKSSYPPNKKRWPSNDWLRKIVTDYNVDAFMFYFHDNNVDKSFLRERVRWCYERTQKAFKSKIVFTNKKI